MRFPPTPVPTTDRIPFSYCRTGTSWLRMPPSSDFVAEARQFTRRALSGCDSGYVDDAEAVTSELVTNAVRYAEAHGDPPEHVVPGIWLGIQALKRHVHLYVRDPFPASPVKRKASETDTSGRRLFIVEALTAAFWVDRRNYDKPLHAIIAKPGVELTVGELDQLRR